MQILGKDFTKLYDLVVLNKKYCCEIEMVHMLLITLEGNNQLLAFEWKEFEANELFFTKFIHYYICYFQDIDCILEYDL